MQDKDTKLLTEAYEDVRKGGTLNQKFPEATEDEDFLQDLKKEKAPQPVLIANDIKYHVDSATDLFQKLIVLLQSRHNPQLDKYIQQAQKGIDILDPISVSLDGFRKGLYEQA